MHNLPIIVCFFAVLRGLQSSEDLSMRYKTNDTFRELVLSFMDMANKIVMDVSLTEMHRAAHLLKVENPIFTMPEKYKLHSNGFIVDFRSLINYYNLRTCIHYPKIRNAILKLNDGIKKMENFTQNFNASENVEAKLYENGRILDQFEDLYKLRTPKTHWYYTAFVKDMTLHLRRYDENSETMFDDIRDGLHDISVYKDEYLQPSLLAYATTLIEIKKCLNYRNINIVDVDEDIFPS